MFIDFAAVKAAVSIEEAVQKLGLQMHKSGNQLRGPCPACRSGGDRALVVTPAKNLYCCFAAGGKGGDQLALVAHISGCETREAAEWLSGTVTVPSREPVTGTSSGFAELDYLQSDNPAVEAVGFPAEVALALGLGFAPKGILRGTVAVPLRLPDGTLIGYMGVTEARLPNRWHLPESNVVTLKKPA